MDDLQLVSDDLSIYDAPTIKGREENYFAARSIYNPTTNLESPFADNITSASRLRPAMASGVVPPLADEIMPPQHISPYFIILGLYFLLYSMSR